MGHIINLTDQFSRLAKEYIHSDLNSTKTNILTDTYCKEFKMNGVYLWIYENRIVQVGTAVRKLGIFERQKEHLSDILIGDANFPNLHGNVKDPYSLFLKKNLFLTDSQHLQMISKNKYFWIPKSKFSRSHKFLNEGDDIYNINEWKKELYSYLNKLNFSVLFCENKSKAELIESGIINRLIDFIKEEAAKNNCQFVQYFNNNSNNSFFGQIKHSSIRINQPSLKESSVDISNELNNYLHSIIL